MTFLFKLARQWRSYLSQLIAFFVLLTLSLPSQAEYKRSELAGLPPECQNLLEANPIEEYLPSQLMAALPKAHKEYRVQLKGDPRIYELIFDGLVSENGELKLKFIQEDSGRPSGRSAIRRAFSEIHSIQDRSEFKDDGGFIFKAIEFPLELVGAARLLQKFTFKPYKSLAQIDPAVEVVGGWTATKDAGRLVANRLKNYDDLMLTMGFQRPERSLIILSGVPFTPKLMGPIASTGLNLNIWRGKFQGLIHLSPVFWKSSVQFDPIVLFHERTHALLYRTYSEKAWVNQSIAFQEALCDFFAGHFENRAEVGPADFVIRNLETREAPHGDERKGLNQVTTEGDHDNSMLMSNLLWEMRKVIGREAVNYHMKPLIDAMNVYRKSFEARRAAVVPDLSGKREEFIFDLEYQMAVMLKYFEPHSSYKQVEVMMEKKIREFNLNGNRITILQNSLEKEPADFNYTEPGPGKMTRMWLETTGLALSGLAIDLTALWHIAGWLGIL